MVVLLVANTTNSSDGLFPRSMTNEVKVMMNDKWLPNNHIRNNRNSLDDDTM